MGLELKDTSLKSTFALANGANHVHSATFDLGPGDKVALAEFLLSAPVLVVAEIVDLDTITYSVEMDEDPAMGSPTTVIPAIIVQTGVHPDAGAAAATARFRVPTNCERYVRVTATNSGAGNASTKSAVLELLL